MIQKQNKEKSFHETRIRMTNKAKVPLSFGILLPREDILVFDIIF